MAKLDFDEALVRKLSALLEETGLTEIEYEAEGHRIRVARAVQVVHAPASANMAAEPGAAPAETPSSDPEVPANALASPMVGTVYTAPEPSAPSFVKVGDQVKQGQILLIIEAMKVMNPIPSPRAGTVTRIFVQDGQPVEYGEPLMTIE